MASPIEKKALYSRPDQEEKGAKASQVLEEGRETVGFDKEDEDLFSSAFSYLCFELECL